MAKVLVGMSGGVDSSAAAKLLLDDGHDVTGVTLKLFEPSDIKDDIRKSGSLSDVQDAKSVAEKLGFEHIVLDLREQFHCDVMSYFIDTYLNGGTPNPCIECNKKIKFGKMLEEAEKLGFDCIATGHYAKRVFDEKTGKYQLIRPSDRSKDQTYVLYGLTQYQLSKTLFPLGEYSKSQIREIAQNAGLINSKKPDSQDICFVPDGDYAGFICRNSDAVIKEGDFLNTSGEKIGTHKGVIHYTIGQRKGLGISLGKPAYVTDKDALKNTVTIGNNEDLFKVEIEVGNLNWISGETLTEPINVTAKTRYSQNEAEAEVIPIDENNARVVFRSPQRAPAKGQAAVFYNGDILLGGGTIK